ncbi:VWFA and cache domain-containing protein 1-like [Mytilus californianus]|uniref:VWFA and cache domain-containing protein 1-like n=1 Tax=Mytilus californianus TaxID=6549 RepID=UPI002245CE7A|nr:VWFA and cache domain-containing protein 1-like [Mytilus californianus]
MATCNQNRYLVCLCIFITASLTFVLSDSTKKRDVYNYNNKLEQEAFKALFSADGYFSDTRQEPVDPKILGGIRIQIEALKLWSQLRQTANVELGIPQMQSIYDSLPYKKKKTNSQDVVERIANRLKERFAEYFKVLKTNKVTVQTLYQFHIKQPITKIFGCCDLQFTQLHSLPQYGCKVATKTSCDLFPENLKKGSFNPGRNLTEVWRGNVQLVPSLKWQYFISVDGVHSEYPGNAFQWFDNCHDANNIRHRNVYVSTVQPQSKHLVIVMDHGNSLSPNQLRIAKGIAKHILSSLSEKDRVAVIGLASKVSFPREPDTDSCLHNKMVPVTYEANLHFSNFIDKLEKENAATNHTLGFKTALDIVQKTMHKSPVVNMDYAMVVYISRGLLSSINEPSIVLETIAELNGRLKNRVIINTYAVIDDGKPVTWEKSFLQNVAKQNFAQYNVQQRSSEPIVPGTMMAINTTKDLSMSVGKFYLPFNQSASEVPVFSLPYIDKADKALTITISQTCFHNNKVIGIMGVDLHMEDIVQDITYYDEMDGSYAFVITSEGYTIMHPSFTRPVKTDVQPMHTDIWHFENNEGFARIRSDMINMESGERTLILRNDVKTNRSENDANYYATYIWKRVENTPFIVAIKTFSQIEDAKVLEKITSFSASDVNMLYHRLDLLPASTMCLHLKQLATEDTSTIFLSPKCFNEPYDHMSLREDKKMVRSYTAYLKEPYVELTNPGIKDGVRDDALATGRITNDWKLRYNTSAHRDSIVRRYIATTNGVFRMYPGTLLDKTFDPSKRTWYTRAFEFPGKVTLTAPYLDMGGAGYITTISHTIYEGKDDAMHSSANKVVAVMGMDLTLGYFYKMLQDHIYICSHKTVRCFIMDDRGYLVAHPALIEPNGKGPVEKQHITHQEPLVANDILNHRYFVHKKRCNRFNDRTIQRYYNFNTSLDGVLTNLVHGEKCSRYQIVHIRGTNAFLGIVNHTCDTATAFCPCSMSDRLCLNCKQMEQTVCECPCECQLDVDFCTGGLLEEENFNPSCERVPEKESILRLDPKLTEDKTPCGKHICTGRTTKLGCISVMGCQWCQVHKDMNPISTPYCADQRVCFGGIEEAPTPYGDEVRAMAQNTEQTNTKTTPVGPVAGGIMGCFLVLAMGVYCYRHHIHRTNHQYITTLQENTNRTSNFYDTDDIDPIDEPGTGHTNFLLATFENPAAVSPYRMSTSYRRPTGGGDSDHGYSTMTPHEDSEHASLPCSEPFISKDRYKPVSYAISKSHALPPPPSSNRRSRSPTPPQTKLTNFYQPIPEQTIIPQQTILPDVNSVIANVQVHMVDTH